jgi:type IV secretory pathway VirD2 relaxase
MPQDDFKPKFGRTRDAGGARLLKHTTRVFRQAGRAGVRALRQKGYVSPSALRRGMGTGVRAAAGLIAPGSRRVIVKARYTRIVGGDLGAARAHIKYIVRDGVTREGMAGHLYDASHDEADGSPFLDRSGQDPHQFRFIVSPEDSARLADLKPFIRDLLSQMERDLETRLDWVAVDHFNTGHPHTHIVIRGRDDQGWDLVLARDYIAHGVRARAQGLITLELGPETDLERTQKLFNETGQERLTRLDRALLARAKDGILVVTAAEEQDPVQQTLRIGRLKTLQRLGLAQERQQGVWQLDGKLESKLRRLGDRADKFRTMQQVLKELGIDRGAAAMALFERGPRKVPLIGKVIGVGMVDEITDRTWVVVDAVDGRVHYADLGRIEPGDAPHRGMLVALAGDSTLREKPTSVPRLEVLSEVQIGRLVNYDGPTWLDEAIVGKFHVQQDTPGFAAELRQALADRGRWLAGQGLAAVSGLGEVAPKPDMMRRLRQRETAHLAETLSRQLNAIHVPHEPGSRISGVYERAIATPTGKLAVIRSADTFTLAPWKPALEPLRGRAVLGLMGPSRVMWTLDRGRTLPGRG